MFRVVFPCHTRFYSVCPEDSTQAKHRKIMLNSDASSIWSISILLWTVKYYRAPKGTSDHGLDKNGSLLNYLELMSVSTKELDP